MLREFENSEIKKIQESFVNGIPFPNVVIDNFLQNDYAKKLLEDFPKFKKSVAKNEFGKAGPKCVHSNIEQISENYRDFYKFINSDLFLSQVSALTGINDLIPDPYLFGAGTHENIEGAELDCHIDFNYDSLGNHRRLNLLIYLNEEWDPSWGGRLNYTKIPSAGLMVLMRL